MESFLIGFGAGILGAVIAYFAGRWSVRGLDAPTSRAPWHDERTGRPLPHQPPKDPVVFIHDADDEEMEVRKQPYLKRVMDAIRGK